MSRKSNGAVLDLTPPYGVGGYEVSKARQRHKVLMQDYDELQKEADALRSKLEVAKQRKLMLAAEVRFLRRKYKHLVKKKNTSSSQERLEQAPTSLKPTKSMKKHISFSKETSQHGLPLIPDSKPPKRKQYTGKQVAPRNSSPVTVLDHKKTIYSGREAPERGFIPSFDLNHKGRIPVIKEALAPNIIPILDKDRKERMPGVKDVDLTHSVAAVDLNLYNEPTREEVSGPSRAQVFDLNEVLTGDEDFQNNVGAVKLEETDQSLMGGITDEPQNDLKLSACRNAGGGSTCVGKRKISWQDPVAVRV